MIIVVQMHRWATCPLSSNSAPVGHVSTSLIKQYTGGPRVPYHQTVHWWATCPILLSNTALVGHVSLDIKQCTGGPRVHFSYQTVHWWATCSLLSNSALVGHVSTSLIKQCAGTCPLLINKIIFYEFFDSRLSVSFRSDAPEA